MTSREIEPMLTTDDVAARAGTTRQTVGRWIKEGRLPAKRYGHEWRVPLSVWEAFDQQAAAAVGRPQRKQVTTCIIAIANHKGGVGKTEVALNLGAALAEQDYRVLLLDLDPQADLSAGLGLDVDTRSSAPNLYNVLAEGQGTLADLITPTGWQGLDIIPGTLDMAGIELSLAVKIGRERVLEEAMTELTGSYDFILLDLPPSLGLITVNGLVVAGQVLVPVQAEPRSVRATTRLLAAVDEVRRKLKHPELAVLGLLLTMTASNNIAREAEELMRSSYGSQVFITTLHRRTKVSEGTLYHAPVLSYAPRTDSAKEFRALASEVLTRLGKEVAIHA